MAEPTKKKVKLMNQSDAAEFGELYQNTLCKVYTLDKTADAAMVWFDTLREYSIERVRDGIRTLVSTHVAKSVVPGHLADILRQPTQRATGSKLIPDQRKEWDDFAIKEKLHCTRAEWDLHWRRCWYLAHRLLLDPRPFDVYKFIERQDLVPDVAEEGRFLRIKLLPPDLYRREKDWMNTCLRAKLDRDNDQRELLAPKNNVKDEVVYANF